MPKSLFFFAGTGDDGHAYESIKESGCYFRENVIRIYIKGCQEERVGNGFYFPDLEIAANNLRSAFQGNELDLDKLRAHFGEGLYRIHGQPLGKNKVAVDDITLEGFSRGAVTTFAAAKKLNDLNIPMHIIANQPVTGDLRIAKRLYSRYCNLSSCHNISSAHTFLASYNLEQGIVHNYFFRQMVAKFPAKSNVKHMLFPHQHHLDWFDNSPIHYHINKVMAENGLTYPQPAEFLIKHWYHDNEQSYFTPCAFMQTIYGVEGTLSKDPIYLDVLVEKAHDLLTQAKMSIHTSITPEQASAIIAIAHFSNEDISRQKKITLYHLVLANSKRSQQFANIINKITEACDYLPRVTEDNTSNKSQMITAHATAYKKSVFLDSFDFLSKELPTLQDKTGFAKDIYKAEGVFRKQALGIERNTMRSILKLLTNFITHVTGIALIVNTINKVHTGNWFFFQHNCSENAVRDIRRIVLSDIDTLSHAP